MKTFRVLFVVCVWVLPLNSYALTAVPFAHSTNFSEGSEEVGFQPGLRLSIGATITISGFPVMEAVAVNLNTGVAYQLSSANPGLIFTGLYQALPIPLFDPDAHLGVWEMRIHDNSGATVAVRAQEMEIAEAMPFVKKLRASGDPLEPTVTWKVPYNKIPEACDEIVHQLRVLITSTNQLFRSAVFEGPRFTLPSGIITTANFEQMWIRVETQCLDTSATTANQIETRSDTFGRLGCLFRGKAGGKKHKDACHDSDD